MNRITQVMEELGLPSAASLNMLVEHDAVTVKYHIPALVRLLEKKVSGDTRAALCVAACEGILDYELKGVNLGNVIDSLRNQVGLSGETHQLQTIFDQCIEQAVSGKGEERHGHGADFMDQPWKQIADVHGLGFLVGQSAKKTQEATTYLQQNDGQEAVEFWKKEIRGAINYLAMAMLFVEEAEAEAEESCGRCSDCDCEPAF